MAVLKESVSGRFLLIVALLALGFLGASRVAAQPAPSEYQVKAAYLLNFARFVEWPADVLAPGAPLNVTIVGRDPFGGALDEVLHGKSANGHPIRVHYQHWDNILTGDQIVFVGTSEESHLPQILLFLGHSSVLTVSDIDRFSLKGGIIELRMVGNRVRFDINRATAAKSKLFVSSRLLQLARALVESDDSGSAAQ
jgi:YfiR/HmsC-like